MYIQAHVSLPPPLGARALPTLKEQIEAWANAEVPKSTLSRNELARRASISSATIHRIMGLDPTYFATPKWQNVVALAKALGVKPPAIPHPDTEGGMAEPDVAPIQWAKSQENGELPPSQSQWEIRTQVLAGMGYMPGDKFILDQSLTPQNRDCVVAQIVDYDTGSAETVLRVFLDGFLVTPNYVSDRSPRMFVDGRLVHIMGVITKSWRNRQIQ
jgi:hypothetical protein